VRGASALDQWLAQHREAAGFVVWEPVLPNDEAPPDELAAHAHNYWDVGRARSMAMQKSGADPRCLSGGDIDEEIVWDVVFDYAPGSATAAYCGRTILRAMPGLVERR
jgi:hypothetical protein